MRIPLTLRALSLLPPLLAVGLAVTACSGGPDPAAKNGAAANRTAPATAKPGRPRTTPPRTAPPATQPTTPPATTPASLTAADGTDAAACRDADCEIVIHGAVDFDMAPRFGFTSFALTYSVPDRLSFDIGRTESGGVHGSIDGTGYLGLFNGVKVTVETVGASGEVLRFQPKTMDPHQDEFMGSKGLSTF